MDRTAITGLVLAGGRAERMGGVDKGLQPWRGTPLVDHVIGRLAPQVATLLVSANRNTDRYASRQARVLVDDTPGFPGPLAGILAGLRAAGTPWLAVVPCDVPGLPLDLVARLASGATSTGAVVRRVDGDGSPRLEPLFCLLRCDLADDLAAFLDRGERKVGAWVARHAAPVPFDRPDDAAAFANFNSPADLER